MSQTLFVVVPAPKLGEEPRMCPVHRNDNPHGGELLLKVGDPAVEVFNSTNIRRRIRSGDLVEATAPSPDVVAPEASSEQ